MIDRMLEQRRAINRVLADDRKADNVTIDWQTNEVLESMNKALKPVSEFTDVLSSENCITASALLPVLELIKEETLGPSDDDTTLTASFKAGIVTILREKYEAPTLPEGSRNLLRKATFMDPRYKGDYDSNVRETKRMIKEEAVTIGRQRAPPAALDPAESGETGEREGVPDPQQQPPVPKKKKLWRVYSSEGQLPPRPHSRRSRKRWMPRWQNIAKSHCWM